MSKETKILVVFFVSLALCAAAHADELLVPAEYPTIQAAIDAAVDGDTVIVADGAYTGPGNRDIDFLGKAITVRSIDPNDPNIVAATVIDCNGTWKNPHRGFYFHSGENAHSHVAGFKIINGYHWDGGAIYCWESSPTISNCIISGNDSDGLGGGGGICCLHGSSPTIINCQISDNLANGGGIYCDYSSPTVSNCTITGNVAERGGGIYCNDSSSPIITKCTISGNWSSIGGGIYCEWYSNPTISNCIITGNEGPEDGCYCCSITGAISCKENSNPVITNCTIAENHGGIYCRYDSSPIISNCTIRNNLEGIYCQDGGSPTITNSTISGNDCCGIACGRASLILNNCLVSGNYFPDGGGIRCVGSTLMITNCTIADNSAGRWSRSGGGIWSRQSSLTITNCIFWGNEALDGPQIYLERGSNAWVSYTDVQGDEDDVYIGPNSTLNWELSNIDADPCFVEPGYWDANGTPEDIWDDFWVEGDYHLLPDSPCIDAGDPNFVADPNQTDLDGNPRIRGDAIDMGAYETIIHEARLLVLPRVVNRKSSKPRIMAWVRLPQGITRDQIDSDTRLILYPGNIEAMRQFVIGNRRGAVSILASFNKAELMDAIPANGRVGLQVLGYLIEPGQYYSGCDTIRIIPRLSKPQRQLKQIVLRRQK